MIIAEPDDSKTRGIPNLEGHEHRGYLSLLLDKWYEFFEKGMFTH